jgi:addiction module HigA family antidote
MKTIIEERSEMSGMFNPPHPGEVLADTVLGERGINVTEFAKRLRMTRTAISRVINGHAAISTDMAIRLEEALGTSAETWLAMQAAYDLWHAKKDKRRKKVARIELDEEKHAAA